jgi:hypothetical protein
MRLARLGFAALLLVSVHLPSAARSACAQGLLLNEILAGPATDWDGSGAFSSRDDEWVEVVNAGATPLELSTFYLTDGDSIPRFSFTGVLAAGATRLVFGRESYDWERANGQPAFGLSLGNSGDRVMLWQVVGADSVLVDQYAYRSHEAAADRAVGRAVADASWQLFDARNPYTGTLPPAGNGCAPTPGAVNTCTSTPAVSTTWGRLKSLYR